MLALASRNNFATARRSAIACLVRRPCRTRPLRLPASWRRAAARDRRARRRRAVVSSTSTATAELMALVFAQRAFRGQFRSAVGESDAPHSAAREMAAEQRAGCRRKADLPEEVPPRARGRGVISPSEAIASVCGSNIKSIRASTYRLALAKANDLSAKRMRRLMLA